MREIFTRISTATARAAGKPQAFLAAVALVAVWLAAGPVFQFSISWHLVLPTVATIVTFLMVFVIQDSQNRDVAALHLKLDELIRVTQPAKNELMHLEHLSQEQLDLLLAYYRELARGRTHESVVGYAVERAIVAHTDAKS